MYVETARYCATGVGPGSGYEMQKGEDGLRRRHTRGS